MQRVLVFPCGSEIGLEIHSALAWSKHIDLIGASSVSSNHGRYVFKKYLDGLPSVEHPEFSRAFASCIREYEIDAVFPAHDSVVVSLSGSQLPATCRVIGSPPETCSICRSKKTTYETLADRIRTPGIFTTDSKDLSFPAFLKPDRGQGSKGTHIARSLAEVLFHLDRDPALLIMEYLPGREYTVDCFTDRHRRLRFIGARERVRIQNGISTNSRSTASEKIETIARLINGSLVLRGAWFFQLKESYSGDLVLLEIAPRIAGTMGLYRSIGVNFPLLSLYDSLDLEVDILTNSISHIEVDRALFSRFDMDLRYGHVYVDLDDTLILNNSEVNFLLVAFLFQCINRRIQIHLLTRHDSEIRRTLRRFRIESIFDSIKVLGRDERKTDFVEARDAIYIDDSFSERAQIRETLGIPVFDLDAVSCLFDWRR